MLDGIYNHRLITALLITNNSIVGIYTQAGTDKGIINIRPEFHVIRDANNVDVTIIMISFLTSNLKSQEVQLH